MPGTSFNWLFAKLFNLEGGLYTGFLRHRMLRLPHLPWKALPGLVELGVRVVHYSRLQ